MLVKNSHFIKNNLSVSDMFHNVVITSHSVSNEGFKISKKIFFFSPQYEELMRY